MRPGGAAALWALLFAVESWAQVSGNVALVSNYHYRGVSLSNHKPAAQVSVAYDHGSGWYAGAFGSTVQLADQSGQHLQALSYAGYANRASSGLAWEVGVTYSAFSGAPAYDYPEVYWGIAADHLGVRVYYAPDYFGQGSGAYYAELNASRPFLERFQLLGHLGVQRQSRRSPVADQSSRSLCDVRMGIRTDLDKGSVELAWAAIDRANTIYPVNESRSRNAWILSLSRSF